MVNWIKITNHFFVLANSYKKIAKSFFKVFDFLFFCYNIGSFNEANGIKKHVYIYIYIYIYIEINTLEKRFKSVIQRFTPRWELRWWVLNDSKDCKKIKPFVLPVKPSTNSNLIVLAKGFGAQVNFMYE